MKESAAGSAGASGGDNRDLAVFHHNIASRRRKSEVFRWICGAMTWLSVLLLAVLLWHVCRMGFAYLGWDFLQNFPSRFPHNAGIKSALWGSIWMVGMTALFTVPIGISAAVFLEEYISRKRRPRTAGFVEIVISNLAGVPSVVYGILGFVVFVRTLGLGRSLLAGSLTMTLLILPIVIIAAREAIKSVPVSLRAASYALGATRWQTVRHHVLPYAMPRIMTGVILAMSRALGEAAPLIMIGALSFVAFVPEGPMDSFTVIPIQIFNWASRPQAEFHSLAAAAIIVLLAVLLSMNALAVWIRHRTEKNRSW